MAAPRFAPAAVGAPRYYSSPAVVPRAWSDAPGVVTGGQPVGSALGAPGPDQGYALTVANMLIDDLRPQEGERVEDAVSGSVMIALRRASMMSRAPVIHDVRLAFGIWAWCDPSPPDDLVDTRRSLFAGVGNVNHHYAQGRRLADLVPEATLRLTPDAATAKMPSQWRQLTGA